MVAGQDKLDEYALRMIQKAEAQVVSVYEGSGCATRDGEIPSPLPIRCTREESRWFENFVNSNCKYHNSSNLAEYAHMEREASEAENWKLASFFYERKQQAERAVREHAKCLNFSSATLGSPQGVYCVCREAVNTKIVQYTEPLGHAVLVLCMMEMACLICASYILHTTRRVEMLELKLADIVEEEIAVMQDAALGKKKGTTKKQRLQEALETKTKTGEEGGISLRTATSRTVV
jgi:hypothetical protein